MARTCDDVTTASWWTVGGRSFPSELEDAMTATAEIQALKKAHRKTWASEVLDVAAGTGKLT